LKYDVIHDALEVICKKSLRRPHNCDDIGYFGDIGYDKLLANNPDNCVGFLSDIGKFGDIGEAPVELLSIFFW
jgi:hypothetical protein